MIYVQKFCLVRRHLLLKSLKEAPLFFVVIFFEWNLFLTWLCISDQHLGWTPQLPLTSVPHVKAFTGFQSKIGIRLQLMLLLCKTTQNNKAAAIVSSMVWGDLSLAENRLPESMERTERVHWCSVCTHVSLCFCFIRDLYRWWTTCLSLLQFQLTGHQTCLRVQV